MRPFERTCAEPSIGFAIPSLRFIEPLRAGTLKIVGARYDLDDGKVDFLME